MADLRVRARAALTIACVSGLVLNLAMFYAFDLTTVAIVLLGFYTYPAFVAVIEMARGHEPVDGIRVGALGLSLAGMVLVVAGSLTAAKRSASRRWGSSWPSSRR